MTVSLQQNEAAPFVKAAWAQFEKPLENLAFDRDFVLGVELKNLPETVHPIVILRKKNAIAPHMKDTLGRREQFSRNLASNRDFA
jgi:hypothetical protein